MSTPPPLTNQNTDNESNGAPPPLPMHGTSQSPPSLPPEPEPDPDDEIDEGDGVQQFPCEACGAVLTFQPGTQALSCQYCGHQNPIPAIENANIEELDFRAALAALRGQEQSIEATMVDCDDCGATFSFDPEVVADACPFCGSSAVGQPHGESLFQPRSLLPFALTENDAKDAFKSWLKGLWFLPNKVRDFARATGFAGMYLPYWTYDANTFSQYHGQRGDDYTTTDSEGEEVTRTRWTRVSGFFKLNFDDLLVVGSESVPRKYAERLEPWDLENLVPYDNAYLSGFRAERYQINVENGFERAKERMDYAIRARVKRQIGGDKQRITSLSTRMSNIAFKHTLLPVWAAAYRHGDKPYRFLVNARTGEVQGERPWSITKILGTVLIVILIVGIGFAALS